MYSIQCIIQKIYYIYILIYSIYIYILGYPTRFRLPVVIGQTWFFLFQCSGGAFDQVDGLPLVNLEGREYVLEAGRRRPNVTHGLDIKRIKRAKGPRVGHLDLSRDKSETREVFPTLQSLKTKKAGKKAVCFSNVL